LPNDDESLLEETGGFSLLVRSVGLSQLMEV